MHGKVTSQGLVDGFVSNVCECTGVLAKDKNQSVFTEEDDPSTQNIWVLHPLYTHVHAHIQIGMIYVHVCIE